MRQLLCDLRSRTEGLRTNVLCADGLGKQCVAAITGLSKDVDRTYQDVKELRIRVATASEKERRKAAKISRQTSGDGMNTLSTKFMQGRCISQPKATSNIAADIWNVMPDTPTPQLPILVTPPPTCASHSRVVRYQSKRHNSYSISSQTTDHGSQMPYPSPSLANLNQRSSLLRQGSLPFMSSASSVAEVEVQLIHTPSESGHIYTQTPQSMDHLDPDQEMSPTDSMNIIAEITGHILETLQPTIQNAVERTLRGRSCSHSSVRDVEAGLGPRHSDPLQSNSH